MSLTRKPLLGLPLLERDEDLQRGARYVRSNPGDEAARSRHEREVGRRAGPDFERLGRELQHHEYRMTKAHSTHSRAQMHHSYETNPPDYEEEPRWYPSRRGAGSPTRIAALAKAAERHQDRANAKAGEIRSLADRLDVRPDQFLRGTKDHWVKGDRRVSGHTLRRIYNIRYSGNGAGYAATNPRDAENYLKAMRQHHPDAIHKPPTDRHHELAAESDRKHPVGDFYYKTSLAHVHESFG